jgi:hypothetical protein
MHTGRKFHEICFLSFLSDGKNSSDQTEIFRYVMSCNKVSEEFPATIFRTDNVSRELFASAFWVYEA